MGRFLLKLERKFGKYSIKNLSLIMIICYGIGYIIEYIYPNAITWLTLNPYYILHGQIWRIFSWILIPPDSGINIFTFIMLYFYYSIGKTLEEMWGDFRYNVYILSGILFTILGAFLIYGIAYIQFSEELSKGVFTAEQLFTTIAYLQGNSITELPCYWFTEISTYYVCMSIFLAFATMFPETRVYVMFIIPIRIKILGIIEAVFVAVEIFTSIVEGKWYKAIIILLSLLNFTIFFFTNRSIVNHIKYNNIKRRSDYMGKIRYARANMGQEAVHEGKKVITRHKCAICGRTELDGDLEFRFCSKCDGNYEYCKDHINNHEHVKRI